ncbi:MAG: hypothetical protein DME25_09695 [Verrucomicrobia bacterium]|nr:MAG: hypothetical protein DME25_09695 [Verrucomicrobiota bacterium]
MPCCFANSNCVSAITSSSVGTPPSPIPISIHWLAERIADALACSPLAQGRPRPAIPRHPVIIEDDVWIGPNATVLKGVRIGQGSFIEAGSLVTRDVPPRSRVLGNPAQIIGRVA